MPLWVWRSALHLLPWSPNPGRRPLGLPAGMVAQSGGPREQADGPLGGLLETSCGTSRRDLASLDGRAGDVFIGSDCDGRVSLPCSTVVDAAWRRH